MSLNQQLPRYITLDPRTNITKRFRVRYWLSPRRSISGGYHATLEEAQHALNKVRRQHALFGRFSGMRFTGTVTGARG